MKNGTLTYGQLRDKLKALGFRQQAVAIDGKRGQVFEHPAIAHSMMILPERDRNDPIEPSYLVRRQF